MAINYANRTAASQLGQSGGYKPTLHYARTADITTWGKPVASVTPGDGVKVTTAHTFATGKCAILWDAKLNSVTHKSKSVGDEGSQELEHTAEFKFLGDNPATFEQIQAMMNDQLVIWVKDSNCDEDTMIQLGDDCVPVTVTVDFDGKTTKDGKKEYTVTFTSKRKVFYLATLDVTP